MINEIKKTSLKTNLILSMVFQFIITIAPLITAPYISRVLGADSVGIYSYTFSLNYYFMIASGLGTASYGIIEIAKKRDDKISRSRVFWGIEIITIISSLISFFLWLILAFLYKEYTKILLILSMNILATIFDISWFYLGIEKVKYIVIVNLLFKIAGIVSIFLFVKKPEDLWIYILLLAGSTLLGNISMWFFVPKFIVKVKIFKNDIFHHLKETMAYFIPTIAATIYSVLDKTLIGLITNDSFENGYYERGTKIIALIRGVTFTSLNTLLGSRMAYLFKDKKLQEINKNMNFALNYTLFLGLGACFGIIGISYIFVPLFFGNGYDKVIYFLILMAPLIPIMGISNAVGNLYYNPSGNRKISAIILIIGAFINALLDVLFIFLWKGYGAIIASIIAEILITIFYIIYTRGFLSFKNIFNYSWKKIISASIMLAFIYLFNLININIYVKLCSDIFCGLMIYIISLILLKDDFILLILKKIMARFKAKKEHDHEDK